MIELDPRTTALVLIDLQGSTTALPLAPRSGPEVLEAGRALAGRFRDAGALVVLVRVAFAPDRADAPPGQVDQPFRRPPGAIDPASTELCEGLMVPGDIVITKRQWGAFHGTELDLQLRRRGIRSIVLGGIATNFGVESTARAAWEHGYDVVLVEDACASLSAELHDLAIRHILPRVSRVTRSADVAFPAV